MPDHERAADRGSRRARQDLIAAGLDIRTARVMAGKTLREVGRAVGMSYSQVGRMERAASPNVTVVQLAKVGAVWDSMSGCGHIRGPCRSEVPASSRCWTVSGNASRRR